VSNPTQILLIFCVIAAWQTFDLVQALKTGRFHAWLDGTATRQGQPKKYWRYVIGCCVMLALCAVVLVWVAFWPDSLR
jgi:hypothetical protein